MRKLYLTLTLLACSIIGVNAQSEWEVPQTGKEQTSLKSTPKSKTKAEKAKKPTVDSKYLQGSVPEENGKIVWHKEIAVANASAQQLYEKVLSVLQDFTKSEGQLPQSAVALVNKKENTVVASVWEWLVFKSAFISLDRAKFNYVIVAKCSDNKVELTMCKLRYLYDENYGKGEETILAEDAINDKNSLNKKKTKLVPGWAKFRTKTIDRKDEVMKLLEEKITK